ncbi:DUF4097 family beta strand repeat-containing protein [Sporosarcina sp. 179-K 3D1 HS]|uniref:DUF4097 family beta strand repeat-containing protein n=1 Tax=Sporosarcina sp. 179-K 3D1 HS TaxID=3232169 RepID=UPI0039A052BB
MQNERKRILAMLENGTITTDEALTLLEKLGQSQNETKPARDDYTSAEHVEEPSPFEEEKGGPYRKGHTVDDFLEDLRRDFTNVSDRFMQFMQTAVHKVKSFDFDTPFGNAVMFTHSMSMPSTGIKEIVLDIDNGKVAVTRSTTDEVQAEFHVKTYNSESEETAKQDFLDKLIFLNDHGKLRIMSDLKMTQVNVDLQIPANEYDVIAAKLLNGSFTLQDLHAKTLRIKTGNGKVEMSGIAFQEADLETANGSIHLNGVSGTKLEAETLNGRVYIDGAIKEVEAQSLNGHVVVTTTDSEAQRIEAKSMSGSIEIYIPSDIGLTGEVSSSMGRLDLQLKDIDRTVEQEQLFHKSIRFKKEGTGTSAPLHISGEAKTGSVLVCYNAKHE